MSEPTVDVLSRCVADACARLASTAGWEDYGIRRGEVAAEYHELEAAVAELIERGDNLKRAVEFLDQVTEAAKRGEDMIRTGVSRDARELGLICYLVGHVLGGARDGD